MNRFTQAIGGAAVMSVVLAAAACSNSGSTSAGPASASAAATKAVGNPALQQLQAKVDATLKAPTGVGLTTSLSGRPTAGKFVVGLLTPLAVAQTESTAQAAAAKMLGWSYRTVQEGTGPQDPAQALNAAIVLRP